MGGVAVRPRGAIVLVAGVVAAALVALVSPATAQSPAAPLGNYGGGAVPAPPKDPYGAGAMTISLRATGDGKVQMRAGLGAKCESATVTARAAVAADGTFTASGTEKERLPGGRRLRTTYTVQGSIAAARATGTASASNRVKTRGRTRSCTSGTVGWSAARPSGAVGTPGAVAPGVALYGNSTLHYSAQRGAIVLRISPDGTRLTRALFDSRLRCGTRTLDGIVDTPRRNLAIGADGRVKDIERFTATVDKRTRVKSVQRFGATIGSAGATGTFSIVDQYIDRRTGRKLGRCRTGAVKWTAAP